MTHLAYVTPPAPVPRLLCAIKWKPQVLARQHSCLTTTFYLLRNELGSGGAAHRLTGSSTVTSAGGGDAGGCKRRINVGEGRGGVGGGSDRPRTANSGRYQQRALAA